MVNEDAVLRPLYVRAMLLPVALLAVTSAALAALVLHLQNLNEWVDHTDVVIARVMQLERLTSDHQSECRGYLLSGNDAPLTAFGIVDQQLSPRLTELNDLVADNPEQVARLERLREAVEQWRAFARDQVASRRAGLTVEQAALRMAAGTPIMQKLRAQIRALVNAEENLRASRLAHARKVTRLTLATALVLVIVLGGFAARAARDQMGRLARTYGDALLEQARAHEAVLLSEARLRTQAEALRDADRRKDEFLGMLSHELRNPLAPIRSSVYILQHADPTDEQAARARTVIDRQSEHLTRIVDDLLDVTRIARGKIELRRSRVDLRDVVARAADDYRPILHDRGVKYEVALPDEKLWADVDATRITQVVGNLLHNAAKFTNRGAEVALTLAAVDGHAVITVRDTGAGIDNKLLPAIFESFVQGERTLARTEGGLGLGLALVKGIAELHGGSVRADSAGPGKGSTFVVRVPLTGAPANTSAHRCEAGRRKVGHRVLVVDDNADAAESLADIVRMLGHEVDVAYDGLTAITTARERQPTAVLCDIGLPGMNGYEVAKALRSDARDWMQLIAVSGYAQIEDVKKALEAGFDCHVAKPADPEQIARLLS